MARFRRKKTRSRGRSSFKRSYSRGSSNPLKVVVPALAYGAARQHISNLAQPLTSKIPLGSYADEAAFGLAGYFMAKKGRGMVRDIGVAMLTVEAASVGHQVINGMSGGSNGATW